MHEKKVNVQDSQDFLYVFNNDSLAHFVCTNNLNTEGHTVKYLYDMSKTRAIKEGVCGAIGGIIFGVVVAGGGPMIFGHQHPFHPDTIPNSNSPSSSVMGAHYFVLAGGLSALSGLGYLAKSMVYTCWNATKSDKEHRSYLLGKVKKNISPESLYRYLWLKAFNAAKQVNGPAGEPNLYGPDGGAAAAAASPAAEVLAEMQQESGISVQIPTISALDELKEIFQANRREISISNLLVRTLHLIQEEQGPNDDDYRTKKKQMYKHMYKHLAGDLSPAEFVDRLYAIETEGRLRNMPDNGMRAVKQLFTNHIVDHQGKLLPSEGNMISPNNPVNQYLMETIAYMGMDETGRLGTPSEEHHQQFDRLVTMMQKLQNGEDIVPLPEPTAVVAGPGSENVSANSSGRESPVAAVVAAGSNAPYGEGESNRSTPPTSPAAANNTAEECAFPISPSRSRLGSPTIVDAAAGGDWVSRSKSPPVSPTHGPARA